MRKRYKSIKRGGALQNTCLNGHSCPLGVKTCSICSGSCRMRDVKKVQSHRVRGDGSTIRSSEKTKGRSKRKKKKGVKRYSNKRGTPKKRRTSKKKKP